ncbi:sirohydrochlorin cobaltochelatase [Anaerosacchariphilus polymeriproducens]|uniref:Sirohydrochlorin cobaltochelatase n=1 Tax=Anaerosacchariphilus polymeriproducens TaxID=1812858 RepID=A0A371AYB1_9FIRM|nr:sirohydrochlorin cobaltochelatase [Anaerosacchariphilus polymeriproducens]RDU24547.1 sirohydrochlorin cobaltochelatase [Anaerosacchariphilus polymeriproducens]
MNSNERTAILIVSFGTTYNDTRMVTIDAIEKEVRNAYPDYQVYRAWTSKIIRDKVFQRDGVKIMSVTEAMETMIKDGIMDVIIQPTHVINGIENDSMKEEASVFQKEFHSIKFGNPLLTDEMDHDTVIQIIAEEFQYLKQDEVLVLMGHGTPHYVNSIYAALDYKFKDKGHSNIFIGTVEAYPSIETLLNKVADYSPKKVILTPFMIVAGDHANEDMSGQEEDSWYNQFKNAGYEVNCILKGLGEYPAIRQLFVQHIADVMG